ncbi:MAG: PLD nuclease N-terminal domain-containing protein [Rhodoglobus sp.]
MNIQAELLVVIGILAAAQITLNVFALVDLYRRPVAQVMLGNKWAWVAIILLVNFVGAILYLAVGRKAAPPVDGVGPAPVRPGTAENVADALYGPRDDQEST